MAKRKAAARTRKAARGTTRKPVRASRSSAARRRSKPARRATATRSASGTARARAGTRKAATSRKAAAPKTAAPRKVATVRPKPAALSRERRQLRDDEMLPSAPSTLGYSPKASQAETGQNLLHQRRREHTEGGSALTAGELDADWSEAYASGEETPGGDMPTPDQDVVEEIGRALGVEYDDAEELKGAEKIESRDRHRWEYDPASAEDYRDRNRRDED